MMMVKAILAIITHRDGWHLLGTLVPLQGSWLRTRLVLSEMTKVNKIHLAQLCVTR